jgi:multisubunit Na+/H+ antiporter MnhE subunit
MKLVLTPTPGTVETSVISLPVHFTTATSLTLLGTLQTITESGTVLDTKEVLVSGKTGKVLVRSIKNIVPLCEQKESTQS